MAMLHYFPIFHSLSSHKIFFQSKHTSPNFSIYHQSNSRFSASSIKKPRGSKKVKSNAELFCDIREFLSSTGFPEDHVPSMKELSEHGRQDLANIVRRRGYKFIKQLLETSNTKNLYESETDTGQSGNSEVLEGYKGQNEKVKVLDGDLSSEAIEEGGQSSFAFNSTALSLQEKVAKFIKHGELEAIEDDGAETFKGNNISRNFDVSAEEQTLVDAEKMKDENEAEVQRLKLILDQKELELNHLKEQIEKEKAALSVLQSKAETEIIYAQKIITEKETELLAAEDSLSGLKEVEVQFSGDCETVEVAGSFNGWHHKIKMDLQTSSNNNKGSRKSRVWSAVLWLYPGIYEIKFIVDGHWRIDPQQESVTRDSLHNNILRVDR